MVGTLLNPAVTVNAEVPRPLVVLPKPLVSWNQPDSINIKADIPLRLPRPRPPIVVMPQPAVAFTQPSINIRLPQIDLPKPDRTIAVLPNPKVSFTPPDLVAEAGGLNIHRKWAVIDTSRLGPDKTYDINVPPINVDLTPPVRADVKLSGQAIIDLSELGPRDSNLIHLPDIDIDLSRAVKVEHDPPKLNVVNLAAADVGPMYQIKLPGLPQSNHIDVNLPGPNLSTITLPGNRQKDRVVVNLLPPDLPPTHQLVLDVDASRAGLAGLLSPVHAAGQLGEPTSINVITPPPVSLPRVGPVVALDARVRGAGARAEVVAPDAEVVDVALPPPPMIGRDVDVALPPAGAARWLPAGLAPGDDGSLNVTTTVVDAKLPSLNLVPALTKPLIQPGNASLSAGSWGLSAGVRDEVGASRGPLSVVAVGGPPAAGGVAAALPKVAAGALGLEAGPAPRPQRCGARCCAACRPQAVSIEYTPVVLGAPH